MPLAPTIRGPAGPPLTRLHCSVKQRCMECNFRDARSVNGIEGYRGRGRRPCGSARTLSTKPSNCVRGRRSTRSVSFTSLARPLVWRLSSSPSPRARSEGPASNRSNWSAWQYWWISAPLNLREYSAAVSLGATFRRGFAPLGTFRSGNSRSKGYPTRAEPPSRRPERDDRPKPEPVPRVRGRTLSSVIDAVRTWIRPRGGRL